MKAGFSVTIGAGGGTELKGVQQPPNKPRVTSSYSKRGRLLGAKRKGRLKKFGPKQKTARSGAKLMKSRTARKETSSFRGASRGFGRRKSSGLLKMIVKLIKKSMRTKASSDFRNRGFKNSGKGGRTGFAGMR